MLTPGMEDHLEQIYLLSKKKGYTRVSEIAGALSVHASSVSKMAQKLGASGYVIYEKYGLLYLTERGLNIGKHLVNRHMLLEKFLRMIQVKNEHISAEVVRMKHRLSWETVSRIDDSCVSSMIIPI